MFPPDSNKASSIVGDVPLCQSNGDRDSMPENTHSSVVRPKPNPR